MLESYLMGIIAVISVLIIIAIYIVMKKSKTTDITETNNFDTTDVIYDSFEDEADKSDVTLATDKVMKDETIIEEKKVEDEDSDSQLLNGIEEGSFGVTEDIENIEEETKTTQKTRKKREVTPHGKITKNNFKEFEGMRILVAEDNLINQKVIKGLLADSGIEIIIADDGQEALNILEKDDNFSIILMDAHMPRIDGFEATRIIRQNPQYDHILIVALSGDTATDDIKKMHDAGMEEQLEKPLKMDALYDIFAAYYEEDENQLDDDEYISVPMTKELDGDKGLEVCGGDKNFYLEILNEFVTNYSDSAIKLNNLLNNTEIAKADKLLLDIVGLTANIGATNLYNIAQNLKEAIYDQEGKSYLTILAEYKKHLDRLLVDIKDFK